MKRLKLKNWLNEEEFLDMLRKRIKQAGTSSQLARELDVPPHTIWQSVGSIKHRCISLAVCAALGYRKVIGYEKMEPRK